jgi:hypothetical protein
MTLQESTPVASTSASTSFSWDDFGVGVAAAFGVVLARRRPRRRRIHPDARAGTHLLVSVPQPEAPRCAESPRRALGHSVVPLSTSSGRVPIKTPSASGPYPSWTRSGTSPSTSASQVPRPDGYIVEASWGAVMASTPQEQRRSLHVAPGCRCHTALLLCRGGVARRSASRQRLVIAAGARGDYFHALRNGVGCGDGGGSSDERTRRRLQTCRRGAASGARARCGPGRPCVAAATRRLGGRVHGRRVGRAGGGALSTDVPADFGLADYATASRLLSRRSRSARRTWPGCHGAALSCRSSTATIAHSSRP